MATVRTGRGKHIVVVDGGTINPDTPFSPGDVAEVVNWYDVTDPSAITITSGRVTNLKDKKGSRDITQCLSSYPSYSATGGGNNNAFITVDPTQYIFDNIGSYPGTNGVVAFAIIRFKSLTPVDFGGGDYLGAIISYYQREYGLVINNFAGGYGAYFQSAGLYLSSVYNNSATTDWQLITMTSAGTSNTTVRYNNQPIGQSCMTGFGVVGPTNIFIGFQGFTANFEFSELIFADPSISAANTLNIQNYLITKYVATIQPYILTFGDSVTNGSCNPSEDWTHLTATQLDVQLSNYGWGGTIVQPNNGSTGVAGRNLIDVYENSFVTTKPLWLHVGFGINDTNQGGINATWKQLYKDIVQEFIDNGYVADTIVIVIPPSTTVRQALMAQTNTYIAEIASELGIRLYDANTDFIANGGDSLFADALHPNAAGNIVYKNGIIATMA